MEDENPQLPLAGEQSSIEPAQFQMHPIEHITHTTNGSDIPLSGFSYYSTMLGDSHDNSLESTSHPLYQMFTEVLAQQQQEREENSASEEEMRRWYAMRVEQFDMNFMVFLDPFLRRIVTHVL
ncbi:MAG: hypothetical protein EOP45_21470 [Sphingobacteriaceae bacterium]|nr:MAG: hypothetical protein EOP45_21470 [Sphingobacteriaceae bacterium]